MRYGAVLVGASCVNDYFETLQNFLLLTVCKRFSEYIWYDQVVTNLYTLLFCYYGGVSHLCYLNEKEKTCPKPCFVLKILLSEIAKFVEFGEVMHVTLWKWIIYSKH